MTSVDLDESRYARQELITWWDQAALARSRVLVVGAGALGNEVVKNLTLVGVGHIEIVDMDTIEHTNLARCVFFREAHEGQFKSDVLAAAAHDMNPDVTCVSHPVAVQRLGAAYLDRFDLVIGALDNREARVWVNQACRKLGRFWIDGAIEGLRGLARMFAPEGACYECTLSEADYKQMSHRRSCSLLAPEEILTGKTPTNATTAGIIAGVQVQEAIKFLTGNHDLLSVVGKCWVFTGDSMESYVMAYRPDEFCLAHDSYDVIVDAPLVTTPRQALAMVCGENGDVDAATTALHFEEDVIELKPCETCGGHSISRTRSSLRLGEGVCDTCGQSRLGSTSSQWSVTDDRLDLTFAELGLGLHDFITVRQGAQRTHLKVQA